MTIQVASCSAAQLFSHLLLEEAPANVPPVLDKQEHAIQGRLTIPEYQRPYCWQDKQIRSLLDDIQSHHDDKPELSYYLGSLILHQTDGKLNIIDGQQRITTLALMASVLPAGTTGMQASLVESLMYEHPISQQQIKHNLHWLMNNCAGYQAHIDFGKLQFTLVITQSEDDAYRFFETQNTGGVRLGGPDIIKAHHLRAIDDEYYRTRFAQQWEGFGDLKDAINALLKGRYWQGRTPRDLPSHKQIRQLRDVIVDEFAQQTGEDADIAFGRMHRHTNLEGEITYQIKQQAYDVRQPLNAGINTVRYLGYFKGVYEQYWETPDLPHLENYQDFILWLKGLQGCGYLEDLYKACLLLYISQFGERHLEKAAIKLFRVVYSTRVRNQKAVRENSIPAFVRENPVLDWIALSYTPEQCFGYLDSFELTVDGSNLNKNSVKKRYMDKVKERFQLGLNADQYTEKFASALTQKVAGGLK